MPDKREVPAHFLFVTFAYLGQHIGVEYSLAIFIEHRDYFLAVESEGEPLLLTGAPTMSANNYRELSFSPTETVPATATSPTRTPTVSPGAPSAAPTTKTQNYSAPYLLDSSSNINQTTESPSVDNPSSFSAGSSQGAVDLLWLSSSWIMTILVAEWQAPMALQILW